MPRWLLGGRDLPKNAALEWAQWCRDPDDLLSDDTLPLHRYKHFSAPILAYSFGDDKWGTSKAADAMMQAYHAPTDFTEQLVQAILGHRDQD